MNETWREILWLQYGAAIDTLENAINNCPDEIWSDPTRPSDYGDYWYAVYHTLYFIDLYLSGSGDGFAPPEPFLLDESLPNEVLPAPYSKELLLGYLDHCRTKCHTTLRSLTDEKVEERCTFPWGSIRYGELLLYTMRHVQHHAAQLNLILRQKADIGSRWVFHAKKSYSEAEG